MINCPLCLSKNYLKVKEFDFQEIRSKWKDSFGFDPFYKLNPTGNLLKLQCTNCLIGYYEPKFFGEEDFYSKISDNSWYYEKNKWEFDIVLNEITQIRPKSLLEFGCGNGNFLEKIDKAIQDVSGTEINELAIKRCHEKGLKVFNCDISQLPTNYEMIVSFQVFEHLDNIKYFLEQTLSKIADGGHLIISVPNPEGYFKELNMNLLDLPPHHNLSWNYSTFKYIEDNYNLKLIKYLSEPLRMVHYEGYVNDLINYNSKIKNSSLKNRVLSKFTKLFSQMLIPHFFLLNKETIIGQSHIAIFRK